MAHTPIGTYFFFFFFKDPPPPEISTLPLPAPLPIWGARHGEEEEHHVADVEGHHHGEDRASGSVPPAAEPETERRRVQNGVVREVAGVQEPGEIGRAHV